MASRGNTYSAVGTVCPPTLLGSLVDLDVLDDQVAGVEALGVGVGLGVLEQAEQELGRLDGPAGLGDAELLACVKIKTTWLATLLLPTPSHIGFSRTLRRSAGAAGIAPHGDGLLLLLDVLEELDGALQLPAVDGLGGLPGVLEGHAQVGTAGAGRLDGLDVSRGVSNLFI